MVLQRLGNDEQNNSALRRGGLVSMRVEMYEAPKETKKSYRAPPQDSFDSPPFPADTRSESRDVSGSDDYGYIGSALIGSGVEYYSAGEYAKALKAFGTALKTQRVSIGEEDICIALTLGNLGAVHLQQGNLEEAERALLESLLMKRRLKPQLIVADTLNNLGNCANLRGDFKKSLEYYREALEDLRQKQGRPEDLANALFNLGRLEIQQQGWESAMLMLTEALAASKEIYGVYHAFVAQTLDLIGFVQLSTGDLDAAIISFTKALGIFRRIFGPLHCDVANSLFNVGTSELMNLLYPSKLALETERISHTILFEGMVREARGELADSWEAYTTARDLYMRLGTESEHSGYKTVRQSISQVEKAIMKQNHERLISKKDIAASARAVKGSRDDSRRGTSVI